jgi:acetylornithine aminotransferase/acetylornithine/N-succinyldiaminopimelate aminotransferase
MKFDEIVQLEKQFLIPTYERMPILAVRGEGCYLYDDQGRKYLDFLGGLAVNSLGYAHPEVLAVLRDEAETLLHTSNLLYHPYQGPLAKKLTSLARLDRAFFANSGAEAIEGALKLVRAYARQHQEPFLRDEILAIENSFHGRTFGALSVTWPEKYRKPFRPLLPGVQFVRLNDAGHLRESFTPRVGAVLLEVIQGDAQGASSRSRSSDFDRTSWWWQSPWRRVCPWPPSWLAKKWRRLSHPACTARRSAAARSSAAWP